MMAGCVIIFSVDFPLQMTRIQKKLCQQLNTVTDLFPPSVHMESCAFCGVLFSVLNLCVQADVLKVTMKQDIQYQCVHACSYVTGGGGSQGEREREACANRRNAMAPCDHNTSSSSGGSSGPFKRRGLVFIFGYLAV